MELGTILLFIIVMLAIIIIVALLVILIPMKGTTLNSTCVNQSNCPIGYVCDQISTGGTGLCKAGFGTVCGSNGDCFDGLVCINSICVATGTTGTGTTGTGTTGSSLTMIPTVAPTEVPPAVTIAVPATPSSSVPSASLASSVPLAPEIVALPPTPQTIIPMPQLITLPTARPVVNPAPLYIPVEPPRLVITNRQSKAEAVTPLTDIIAPRAPIASQPTTRQVSARAVLPQVRRPVQAEATSIDDEINSDGRTRDGAFDIHSGASTDAELVSTPYEERDGAYYCRTNILPSTGTGHAAVIDVCSYSNATIFLLEDGHIIAELLTGDSTKRHRVTNNILLTRVTSFNGYLYGVGADAKIYTLSNNYFATTNWVWTLVDWAPVGIIQISSTYDSAYLWVQTAATGYLYNKPGAVSSVVPYAGKKRVYGKDMHHYLDINQSAFSAVVNPSGTIVNDIYDGALSYYDEVVVIRPSERNQYRRIVIINWKPYYVQK